MSFWSTTGWTLLVIVLVVTVIKLYTKFKNRGLVLSSGSYNSGGIVSRAIERAKNLGDCCIKKLTGSST